MAISIETAALCLIENLKADKPTMMWSAPGVGKSSVVHQIVEKKRAEGKRYGLVDFRALLRDPVDLRGLPSIVDGKAKWLVPDDLPQVERDGEEGILFLDEINASSPTMQAACFGLILERKVGDYVLPPAWRIVAAGNRQSDRAAAQKMPTALENRMSHLNIEPDVQAFSHYVIDHGHPVELSAFIRFRSNLLHKMDGSKGMGFPSPRSWIQAGKSINAPAALRPILIAGDVGEDAANEFEGFLRVFHSLPSIDSVIMDPDGAKVPGPTEVSARYAIASALATRAEPTNLDNILRYMKRMDREFTTALITDATRRDVSLTHTAAFGRWAIENQDITL